jgi:Holliday junction resolvasome RuvABC DNA-binding subunit
MVIKKYKNLKPTDYEISLIYKCPNCRIEHWLSIKEAATKNFKVVCDCDTIFTVKLVKSITVNYVESEPKKEIIAQPVEKVIQRPNVDFVENCAKILVGYGFTKNEAVSLVNKTYESNPSSDISTFIKSCISNFGGVHG